MVKEKKGKEKSNTKKPAAKNLKEKRAAKAAKRDEKNNKNRPIDFQALRGKKKSRIVRD